MIILIAVVTIIVTVTMIAIVTSKKQLKEICPRGNNKVLILYFLIHDKGLLFMLKSY